MPLLLVNWSSSFLPHSPKLLDILGVFLMKIVPLEAAHLFDLKAAILGWLLAAVQPKKQLPRHSRIVQYLVRILRILL